MRSFRLSLGTLAFALIASTLPPAAQAETIDVGTIGGPSAVIWPFLIGSTEGFFAAADLKLDIIYIPSSAAVQQQLAAGSLAIADGGLNDPIRAIFEGAPIALVRLEGQVPPYALDAQKDIKTIADLRGKSIIVGSATDITRIYLDRMMAASGLKPGDYDLVYAGATVARFSALQSGAVAAAILYPPYNFHAEAEGFVSLGLVFDYARDLPFSGISVNRAWAARHKDQLAGFLAAYNKSVAWFDDDGNRSTAIGILADASKQSHGDVEKSYDLYRKIDFFEASGRVSKQKVAEIITLLKSDFGDTPLDMNRLFLPGMTQMTE